jgi:tetratricopeptide (TPR) repeat protein
MARQWLLSIGVGMVVWVGSGAAAGAPDKAADLRAAVKQARDGDMQADWNKMLDARGRIAALAEEEDLSALAHYYMGYTDWRLSSLAFIAVGPKAQAQLAERAVTSLEAAVRKRPEFPDAHALLATCIATLVNADRSRIEALAPRLKAAWQHALPGLADNPRVMLLRAIALMFAPPEYGGNRDKSLELWKQAIQAFEKERPEPLMPDWGHAEALAWLGGAYLMVNQPQEAVAVLERAVALRPDFWWAAKAALPVARSPIEAK